MTGYKGSPAEKRLVFLVFLLMLPHFEPSFFDAKVPVLDLAYNVSRVVSAVYIVCYICCHKQKISRIMLIFIVIQAWYFTDTILQVGFSKRIMLNTISWIVGCLIVDAYADRHVMQVIEAQLLLYEVLIYLNLVTMLLFPKGLYVSEWQSENWLLGFRNSFTLTFVPAMALSMIWSEYTKKKGRMYALVAVCCFSAVRGHSATCLMVVLILTVGYFLRIYRLQIFTAINATIGYVVFFLSFVVFRILDYLAPLFRRFGRNVTLTGRTFIWAHTIEKIQESPIIGYGQQRPETRIALVPEAYAATSAHNFILEHLYSGGVIQLSVVVLFLTIIVLELQRYKKHAIAQLMVLALVGIYLIYLVEASFSLPLYTFLILCANVKRICRKCEFRPAT